VDGYRQPDVSIAPKLAVFRCAVSPSIGWGHLKRCEALGAALTRAGWRCEFAIDAESSDDLAARWDTGVDLLVVDDYALGADFETAARPWAKVIVAIDDLANRKHAVDLLVDQNVSRVPTAYDSYLSSGRALAGPGYALLDVAFWRQRATRAARTWPKGRKPKVLLSLGGAPNHTLDVVLDGLVRLSGAIEVNVVIPNATYATKVLEHGFNLHVAISADEMADLVAESDIAVGAGGVSLLERCCVGLPSVVVTVAGNQRDGSSAAARAGTCNYIGEIGMVSAEMISRAVKELLEDRDGWQRMSHAAARICDGLGAARLAARLSANAEDRDGNPIALRRAELADCDRLLAWQRHPATRRFARTPAVPSEQEHSAWLNDRLACGGCIFNIILADDKPAGTLRLDRLSNGREGYEVSIAVDPARHGRGIARAALRQASYLVDSALWAFVADDNLASRELFRSAGYRHTSSGWYVAGP
jgi:UDP-2,4-diacetamido-2,4,6-trideoxy-beta-L-altropyranose hydrolase